MGLLLTIEEPAQGGSAAPSLQSFLELGFRPLYLAGALWACVAVVLWIFFPSCILGTLQGVIWHGHEMLWGFVVTIAVGFLMTAGANWTGINPMPGKYLALSCVLWLVARIAYLLPGEAAFAVALLGETLFLLFAAMGMGRAVLKSASRRNYGVPIVLVALAVSNLAYLAAAHAGDFVRVMQYFYVGFVCMAILVLLVGRRVIPFFAMRAVHGMTIPMLTDVGHWQLGLSGVAVVLLVFSQPHLASIPLAAAGGIAIYQVVAWRPLQVLKQPILWILYAGYFFTGIGLILVALRTVMPSLPSVLPIHTIAMGGFSVLIMGMITRTALGHLGRPLALSANMIRCYWLVLAAAWVRLMAIAYWPLAEILVSFAAVLWVGAFGLYLREFYPMMIRPRRPPTMSPPATVRAAPPH